MHGVEGERHRLRQRTQLGADVDQRAVAQVQEAAQLTRSCVGIEGLRGSDRLSRLPAYHLHGDRVEGRTATLRIAELRIGVTNELDAITRGHEQSAIGLRDGSDADEARELAHKLIALVEQSACR